MATEMPLVGRSLAIFIVSTIMLVLAVIAVTLRLFVRLFLVRAFGWDDGIMAIALVLFLGFSLCCILGSAAGIGHSNIEFESLVTFKKALLLWWLAQILYIWASAFAKVSIGVALLRLAIKKSQRLIIWVVISIVIAIGLMFWFVLLLDCKPVSYFWHQVDPSYSGKCTSINTLLAIAYLYSSLTIVCDLTLGILPIFVVWNLQMNRRTKIAVAGILGLGTIASVAVIIRLPFLHFYADVNFLYSTYQIAIWSIMETGLGIFSGSMMTLRPLFRWFLDGSISYGRNARSASGPTGSRRYPIKLSQPQSHELNSIGDPSYWRPDIEPSKGVINTVSSPRSTRHAFDDDNSSQEALYVEPISMLNPNRVTVRQTFDQVVTERHI